MTPHWMREVCGELSIGRTEIEPQSGGDGRSGRTSTAMVSRVYGHLKVLGTGHYRSLVMAHLSSSWLDESTGGSWQRALASGIQG